MCSSIVFKGTLCRNCSHLALRFTSQATQSFLYAAFTCNQAECRQTTDAARNRINKRPSGPTARGNTHDKRSYCLADPRFTSFLLTKMTSGFFLTAVCLTPRECSISVTPHPSSHCTVVMVFTDATLIASPQADHCAEFPWLPTVSLPLNVKDGDATWQLAPGLPALYVYE